MSETKAREGQWYVDRANHEFFLVIAIDETDGLIDVRDRYGDIDEFDLDEWDAMDLVLCSAPTQWWWTRHATSGSPPGRRWSVRRASSTGTTSTTVGRATT